MATAAEKSVSVGEGRSTRSIGEEGERGESGEGRTPGRGTHVPSVLQCNTHTPGHPSTADEAWYWPKCVLHIG